MTTMKAIVQETYGSADVLQVRDIDQPTAGAGEVLLRVHAAGVSRGDVHLMTGEPYLVRAVIGIRRPRNRVLGQDVAGTVVAIGPDVTRFRVGDEVFGIARGAFAEYAVAREIKLAHKPSNLTFTQAAAMPVSGLTALRALDAAGVRAGQTVLVIGASGGVGTYAVQLAVAAGAIVTGVASAAKAQLVRELGAAEADRVDAESKRDGVKAALADSDAEAARIVAEARDAAARLESDTVTRAEAEAVALRERAAGELVAARRQAESDLAGELSRLALGAAEQVVHSNLDDATHQDLIEAYIRQVGATN